MLSISGFSQEKKVSKGPFFNEIGFWSGFGYGINTKNIPEGNYQPYYFIAHLACKPFFKGNSALEQFQFYLEPQYNYVRIAQAGDTHLNEHEFGLNVGVKYLYPIANKWKVFIYVSTGPHSFSATTAIQAPGYLFSDNLGMGIYHFFTPKWSAVFTYRIRHMSNADTRQPNNGINTDNFLFGIGYHLK
jgi:hypothetical protein